MFNLNGFKLKKGDIIGIASDSVISYSIRELDNNSPVSHILLYIGVGKVVEAIYPKVKVRDILQSVKCASVIVIFKPINDFIDRDRLVKACLTKVGVSYSFFQIFIDFILILFSRIFKKDFLEEFPYDLDRKGMVCSELIGWGLNEQGYRVNNKRKNSQVSPSDFFMDVNFEKMFI